MPTPEWVKEASRKKRQRTCVICNTEFLVRSVDRKGATCSKPCRSELNRRYRLGVKQSEETKAKRRATLKAIRNDPERKPKWDAASREGLRKYMADPANRAAMSARSSAHMHRMHADPEFQKRRSERSSRTMKETWIKHREKFTQIAIDRYARGEGVNSEEGKANKVRAAKWIMQKAQEALHTETDFDERYAEIQAQLRREMPYDGPLGTSDYYDYLKKLGVAVASHPVLREIADAFMSEAIPRFSKLWATKKGKQ